MAEPTPKRRRSRAAITVAEAIARKEKTLLRLAIQLGDHLIDLAEGPPWDLHDSRAEFDETTRLDIEDVENCIRTTAASLERLRQYPLDDRLTPTHPFRVEGDQMRRTRIAIADVINWEAS